MGHSNQDLTPAMAALLDSLRSNGSPWTGHEQNDRYGQISHPHMPSQRPHAGQLPTLRNAHPVLGDVDLNLAYPPPANQSLYPNYLGGVGGLGLGFGGGVAQTRSGYTPEEELILNAHASMRRKGHGNGNDVSIIVIVAFVFAISAWTRRWRRCGRGF